MLQTILLSLAELTVTMSVLILVLLVFSRWFGRKYTARCRYILWIVVIFRLCIPIGTPFIPALFEIPLPADASEQMESAETEIAESYDITAPSPSLTLQSPLPEVLPGTLSSTVPAVSTEEILPEPVPIPEHSVYIPLTSVLFSIWILVALLLFIIRFIGYLTVSARLRNTWSLPAEHQADLCRRLGLKLGIREKRLPALYITREVQSPMLCGFCRPVILLPDIPLTDNQLTGVLAHELTHRRRNDLWVKLACMTAISLHWFNPFVYIAAGRCNREMELSCDELVLAGMDEAVRVAYGKVMLDIIKRCSNPSSSLTTHFNPRTSAVRERFESIMDGSGKHRGLWLIAVILFLCAAAGSLVAFSRSEEMPPVSAETESDGKATETETEDTATETEDKENDYYEVKLTAAETAEGFGGGSTVYMPVPYGPLDMTVLAENELPIPVSSTEDQETLYYYNQISYLGEYTSVFAVTGALLQERDPGYAYVFCRGAKEQWTITALPAPENTLCKGVVLRGVPAEDGLGWLLGLLADDGSIRFYRSQDGNSWEGSNTSFHPADGNSWLVQFSKHTGVGGETLCMVFDGPDWDREQIWLSYDWGETFTRYDIPLTSVLPGDFTEMIYLEKTGAAGSG